MKIKNYTWCILFSISLLLSCGDDTYDNYHTQMLGSWGYSETTYEVETNNQEATQTLRDYIELSKEKDKNTFVSFEKQKDGDYLYKYYPNGAEGENHSGICILYEDNISIVGMPGIYSFEMNDTYQTFTLSFEANKSMPHKQLIDLLKLEGIELPTNTEIKLLTISKTFKRKQQ